MTCAEARDRLSALLDDLLDGDERALIEAHLAGCAECRRELAGLRQTVALVQAIEPVRAPAGFVDRVLAAARPAPWHRRIARWLFQPLRWKLPLEALAVALVGVTALYVYRQSPELQDAARVEAPVASRPVAPAPPPPAPPPAPATAPAAEPSSAPPAPALPERPAPLPAGPRPAEPQAGAPPVEPKTAREETRPAATAKEASPPADSRQDLSARDAAGGAYRGASRPPTAEREEKAGAMQPDAGGKRQASEEPARAKAATPSGTLGAASAPPGPETGRAAQARSSLAAAPLAEVSGRLAVRDRQAALRALGELAARVGAAETHRPPAAGRDGAESVELVVARGAYPALIDGLARIGEWRPDRELSELPDQVRVTVRLAD
jgi:hypothetical protein